jgi:hypothetical protein
MNVVDEGGPDLALAVEGLPGASGIGWRGVVGGGERLAVLAVDSLPDVLGLGLYVTAGWRVFVDGLGVGEEEGVVARVDALAVGVISGVVDELGGLFHEQREPAFRAIPLHLRFHLLLVPRPRVLLGLHVGSGGEEW